MEEEREESEEEVGEKDPREFVGEDGKVRCWTPSSEQFREFHDSVWGRPVFDASALLGSLSLQLVQSGLSWAIVWKKREGFRKAFANWDVQRIAEFGPAEVEELLQNPEIIRNRRKVEAIINNAKLVAEMESRLPNSWPHLVWKFSPAADDERLVHPSRRAKGHMRSDFKTPASERHVSDGVHPTVSCHAMHQELSAMGFRHLGGTVLLNFMQMLGLVNHHRQQCFAFQEIEEELVAFKEKHGLPQSESERQQLEQLVAEFKQRHTEALKQRRKQQTAKRAANKRRQVLSEDEQENQEGRNKKQRRSEATKAAKAKKE